MYYSVNNAKNNSIFIAGYDGCDNFDGYDGRDNFDGYDG